jgi:D-3-phosphoglycerate dehydrogenase
VTLHVPLNDNTRQLIDGARVEKMQPGATLLNFSRGAVVDERAILNALVSSRLHAYVSDFPTRALLSHPRAIILPHLGASTSEAEENCAAMVSEQVRDFLENGNIRHSVNFPNLALPRTDGLRIAIANRNIPSMVSQITSVLAEHRINIVDMLNKSRGEQAYTLIDIEDPGPPELLARLGVIEGILSVRVI